MRPLFSLNNVLLHFKTGFYYIMWHYVYTEVEGKQSVSLVILYACLIVAEHFACLFVTGMNQFNHMTLSNAQTSMGPRAASPMTHPQQMNISSVPSVRITQGDRLGAFCFYARITWNKSSENRKTAETQSSFILRLQTHLFRVALDSKRLEH